MPREDPYFRKCCYCIPLQSCLHIWVIIKVIADIAVILFLVFLTIFLVSLGSPLTQFNVVHVFIILSILLLIDGCFMVLLSIGLCKKNLRSLRVFYLYILYMSVTCVIFVLVMIFCLVTGFIHHNEVMVLGGISGFINTGINVVIILTLKSEMTKLRNKQQFEFVQMPTLKGEADNSEIEEGPVNP